MTKTIKETSSYELIEYGGSFRIIRKQDNMLTLWYTGAEGKQWAKDLRKMRNVDFDAYCKLKDYY